MKWLLTAAALARNPGNRLVDISDKIPRGLQMKWTARALFRPDIRMQGWSHALLVTAGAC